MVEDTNKYFASSSLYVFFPVPPVSSQRTVDEYDNREDDEDSVYYYCITVMCSSVSSQRTVDDYDKRDDDEDNVYCYCITVVSM